jgi:hypothetical protein
MGFSDVQRWWYDAGEGGRSLENHYVASPYGSSFGAIAPRISGSMSLFGSVVIITIILRSFAGLKTSYHRLLFGMSLFDICASVAMGLSHLPMPANDLWYETSFQGTKFGNTATCTMQGFFFVFGSTGAFLYNGALCIFYTSTIAFSMHVDSFKRRFELVSHLVPIAVALSLAIYPLPSQMYNLTEGSAWCNIKRYPSYCGEEYNSCVRGRSGFDEPLVLAGCLAFNLIFIIVCLSLVCLKVFKQKREFDAYARQIELTNTNSGSFVDQRLLQLSSRNTMTRAVTLQSIAYVAALFLTYAFPIMSTVNIIPKKGGFFQVIKKLALVFQPMQGFFNFLIFVGSKVAVASRRNPESSIYSIITSILKGTNEISDDMIEFTGIDFVMTEDVQLVQTNASENPRADPSSQLWERNSSVFNDNIQTDSEGLSTLDGNQHARRMFYRRGNLNHCHAPSSVVSNSSAGGVSGGSQGLVSRTTQSHSEV